MRVKKVSKPRKRITKAGQERKGAKKVVEIKNLFEGVRERAKSKPSAVWQAGTSVLLARPAKFGAKFKNILSIEIAFHSKQTI